MAKLMITAYEDLHKEEWDDFVMKHSVNGTFLQTRRFLEYHKDRFTDASLIVYKGTNTIAAVIPACAAEEAGRRIFSSHQGSTFGGIVLGEAFYNIEHVEAVIEVLEGYIQEQGYDEIQLKCTSDIFAKGNMNLLNYFLCQRGYTAYDEMSSYIDFTCYKEEIISNFSAARRRGYRYSLRNEFQFRELHTYEEICQFYEVLCENLQKFDTVPVHTLAELIELKEERLGEIVRFYGVYDGEEIIAGSMVFEFEKRVFHTQYLAAKKEKLALYPMNFMNAKLIETAREEGFRYFSFGISTEQRGKILNKQLAQFKEGFGTQCGINKIYIKRCS